MPGVSDPHRDLIGRISALEDRVSELSRATGQTQTALRDGSDNVVLTTDQGGAMLARPYIPIDFYMRKPYDTWIRCTNQSWESLLRAHIVKQHPAFSAIICGISGPGSGAGNPGAAGGAGWLRLTVNGVPVLPDIRINAPSAGFELPVGPFALPGDHLAPVVVELWARSDFTDAFIAAQIINGYSRESEPPGALAPSEPQT